MENETIVFLFFGLVGGIVPALAWLAFWLKEDKKHPEPKRRIFIAFVAGMVSVPIALFLELASCAALGNVCATQGTLRYGIVAIIVLASIEESAKFAAAGLSSMRSREYNEPVDAMIYMISAALGFAALENGLFLINQLQLDWGITLIFLNNNLRFVGAMLLHIVSSAFAGGMLALAFYKGRALQISYAIFGLLTAIILHTAFNFLIIGNEESPNIVFYLLWGATLLLILFFEKVKRIQPPYGYGKKRETLIS